MMPDKTTSNSGRGTLLLVVGPSGVGKDSVIGWAHERLAGRSNVVFARRTITRRADAGGEDHQAATTADFEAMAASGGFLLSWRSHGLCYGIPAAYRRDLENGAVVVVNSSRTIVTEALHVWPAVVIALIHSAPETIAARLIARGREAGSDIAERLSRAPAMETGGATVRHISNDGPLAEAGAHLVAVIESLLSGQDAEKLP